MSSLYPANEDALQRAARRGSSPGKMRALRRMVDEGIGPDTSDLVHTGKDGWSVVFLESITDLQREGWLLKNCMRQMRTPMPGSDRYSLRDDEDIPHVVFRAWSIVDTAPEVIELLDDHECLSILGWADVRTDSVAIMNAFGRTNTRAKDEHLERLQEFAAAARTDERGLMIGSHVLRPYPIRDLSLGAMFATEQLDEMLAEPVVCECESCLAEFERRLLNGEL